MPAHSVLPEKEQLYIWPPEIWSATENRAKELNDEGCNVKTVYNDATEKETYTSMVEEVFKNEWKN